MAVKMETHEKDTRLNLPVKIFFGVYAVLFTIVTAGVIFGNTEYGLEPGFAAAAALGGLLILTLSYYLIGKNISLLDKYKNKIIAVFLALLLAVNIGAGLALRYEPVFDLGAIFTGASEWAVNGDFMANMNPSCDPDYFYYFPNNLGGMWFLFIPFKIASLFGVTDFFAAAVVFNALLTVLTVLFTVLICRRLLGTKGELMALCCVLTSLPFYFMAPVFYTDSLSAVFPVMIMYFYLLWDESGAGIKEKIIYGLIIALACAVGALIKFTVIIALIAIVIYHLCVKNVFEGLALGAACAAVLFAAIGVFNGFMYAVHLDKTKAEKLGTPYIHWVMMSLEGNGRYNPGDYEFTRSFEDTGERDRAIIDRIGRRLREKGPAGTAYMAYEKSIVLLGDGTYSQSDFLDDNPVNSTWLHSFLLYDGENHWLYQYICSGMFFALQIFAVVAAWSGLVTGKRDCSAMLPLLCVFGAVLFFSAWEVSGRYITNFVPMIITGAAAGMQAAENMIKRKRHKCKGS